MKYLFFTILLLILSMNFSCVNLHKGTILDCGNEYFRYYNYTNKVNSNEIKHIPNLELIDNKSLTFYLENGVDFKDIKQEQLISLQRSVFFNNSSLLGNIKFYIIGYTGNENIKQYLAVEFIENKNSHLYLINQVNDTISSAFLVYSNYNTGFSSESFETKMLSDFTFQIKVYYTSDIIDNKKNYSGKCNYLLRLNSSGYLESFTDDTINK